jgi:hypothetical protein
MTLLPFVRSLFCVGASAGLISSFFDANAMLIFVVVMSSGGLG